MKLTESNPFVRQALIATLNRSKTDDVFFELRSADCRLFYILSGSGSMTIEGERYSLSPGCAILFQSGTTYMWEMAEQMSIEYIAINFDYTQDHAHIRKPFHPVHADRFHDRDVLEQVTMEDAPILNVPIVLNGVTAIESRLRLLTTEYNVADDYFSGDLLSLVLKSVIISMIREARIAGDQHGSKELTLTRSIIRYIQNHYGDEITYESLSEQFFMNPVYINRIFRKNTGSSLHSFLLNYRINMAMELLRSGSMPVKEIGPMVGFTDLPHFMKTFKKITGITPGRYRNLSDDPQ
ncbi:MAG: AraC family transcriptional regulator [Ruminococcaceae bacterium]|nr:AraC family transcriptional regulator [Oscillospiraceae bacterium]